MEEKWFSVDVESVKEKLGVPDGGISADEAQKRLSEYGNNELRGEKKKNVFVRFLEQFKDVMVIILICAAIVTTVIAIVEKNYSDFIDVGIILAIVIINAIIGVVQESKAEQALEALKNMSKPYAKVRRGGEIVKVESATLVPGDTVILEAGDVVPADMRLTDSRSLKIEESALTGESLPSEKDAFSLCAADAGIGDRYNMAFSTSVVTYGRGEGIVTGTGMNTEMGKIADMLADSGEEITPIQKKLDKTGKFISVAVIIIAVVIFAVTVLSSISFMKRDNSIIADTIIEAFMTAVAIAVAAIPEGLTAVITIIMAIGVQRMSKRNAIIKKLPAVETLGSTEIICSDKTGTLTLNKMTVKKTYSVGEEGEKRLLECMTLCNDTVLKRDGDKFTLMGDPTETALVAFYNLTGDSEILNRENPRVDEVPFDSDRKLMTTVNSTVDGRIVFTKGAPDMLVEKCTRILDSEGVRAITSDDKKAIAEKNSEFASEALRVLAYAYKPDDGTEYESDLVFIGLTGMIDPPREEVKDAVAVCKKAGITAIMITGDHKDTAYAIAKELKICDNEKQVVTGAQLSDMSDEELARDVDKYRVYARVSPEHKVKIVKAWKARGKIVAMTGDGVNDAPSIKAADIGVGMGITGTDVTKGAADMVLADDNFATIVEAVKEGRKIFDNMQKTIQFLLSANICEVLCLFIVTLAFSILGQTTADAFLLPIQILWVNLVTDSLPALALGMEEGNDDIMNNPPRKSDDNLFAGHFGINIVYQGVIQTAIILAVFFSAHFGSWGHEVGASMAFITLCLVQLFHCFNAKSLNGTVFRKDLFKNKFMLLAFGVGCALTVGVAVIPGLNDVF
ncbi:MAG: calcium-translocating P-type ATPase, PMCA-type, partial [Christensenellales bacterium]